MRHLSLGATRLIHEHIATLATFVYSRNPLRDLIAVEFGRSSKYLDKTLLEIPESRAERAIVELGLYIRVLCEAEDVSGYMGDTAFGVIVMADEKKSREPLLIREVANKIIHAERYEFYIAGGTHKPLIACYANQDQAKRFRWDHAEIDLVALISFCGQVAS